MKNFLIMVVIIVAIANTAKADNVTLAWDPSPDNVSGYIVFYAEVDVLSNPSTSIDAGNVLQKTMTGFVKGHKYYFALKAYNQYGQSGFSEQITWTVPLVVPSTPSMLKFISQ